MSRQFPILFLTTKDRVRATELGLPATVPWEMLTPHEEQVTRTHGQSFETLASRGGLDVTEIVAILEDRRWHRMTFDDAAQQIIQFIERWEKAHAP